MDRIIVEFDKFSRMGPNLFVHSDRNDKFIVTAKNIAGLLGAQTIANMFKSHETQTLIEKLNEFFAFVINFLNKELANAKTNKSTKSIKMVSIVCREFKLAYNGLPDTNNTGIFGLIETYKNDELALQLENTIIFIKETIDQIHSSLKQLKSDEFNNINVCNNNNNNNISDLVNCPEAHFTDDDWAEIMNRVPLLEQEYVGMYKYYINYSLILTINLFNFQNYDWWNEVVFFENDVKIILGGIPLVCKDRNDLIALQKLNVGAVLSVTEIFENTSIGNIYSPVTPDEWKTAGIKHYQIPSMDFWNMHIETIQKGVEFIHWNIKNGRSVYVHCKSGKSRSFLIVVAYLIKYLDYTAENAMNFVKSNRIQAGFGKNSRKMCVLNKFEQLCKID